MSLSSAQLQVLSAMMPDKKLRVSLSGTALCGYVNSNRVCKERTWRVLLQKEYIVPIKDFVYVLSPQEYHALKNIKL